MIFKRFKEKILENNVLPASSTRKAISYMLSREKHFKAYLDNPDARYCLSSFALLFFGLSPVFAFQPPLSRACPGFGTDSDPCRENGSLELVGAAG
jgi:hypothetical protein